MKWVERKFMFQGLEGTYDNILERLAGTDIRIKHKIHGLSLKERTSSEEGWSIQVHIGHLLTLENLWLNRLKDFENAHETLTPWEETNSATENARFNDQSIDEILSAFEETRSRLIDRLRRHSGNEEDLQALHPRLKTLMRLLDMVYFIAEHDDHHLASIEKIKAR